MYNRRDMLGHWVRLNQRDRRPCTHACCRGYRVHSKNYPVIMPSPLLRRASDEDLAQHFTALSALEDERARRGEAQILHEMERRDQAEEQRRRHREAVLSARAGRRMEQESERQRIQVQAEEYTRGYLVTAQGRARGISDEEVLSGRESVFIRYATPEAKEYFAQNPRPTGAYFRGQDSRIRYSDRPTRTRRPTRPRAPRAPVTVGRP